MVTYDHETYLSPFTWRYGSDEMRAIWSEIHRRRLWRRVWVALATAQAAAGLVTDEELADIQAHQDEIDLARAHEIEAEIGHDLMAELRTFAAQCPVGGGRLHLGATSADVQDNAEVLRVREALTLIHSRLLDLLAAFAAQIERWADFPCLAYTHLQPAEPTTVGYRLCIYAQDLLADLKAVRRIRAELRGKGFKGAVGTSASYAVLLEDSEVTPRQMEQQALTALLGLEAVPVSGQVYPRKQDLEVLNGLAGIAQSLHKFAFDLRVLQASPYGEWREPFGQQQVGSSAMPFKRNPVTAEKICSLARFVAALPRVAWDNAANSLLERTLDDSANRRLILPEAFLAVDEMLLSARRIVAGLTVNEEAVARNLAAYGVFAASERLLMALVRAGADRQAMHERVRIHSMAAWAAVERGEPNPLVALLCADKAITAYLPPSQVEEALDAGGYVGDAPHRCRAFLAELRAAI
ncbi:MAG: adenylosuccinate lyase [Anaerolineae bacterium]|jgi:adenylosuccinate lyase|nr:adenylosuccinate lyase [Anaerolineae bacterium]MDH7472599.1 adenylosuccinate lyase [Anaerolineae bacterium]